MKHLRKLLLVATRLLAAAFVVVLVPIAACAYTIVLRDGRRIEIPAQFSATKATVTYEVSAGLQVTLQMAAIDVAATEAANGEQPGGLLNHKNKHEVRQQTANSTARAAPIIQGRRSITNSELASYARVRLASELAYERRRKELGLPSLEESRQRSRLEAEQTMQELEENRLKEAESENYWRARAAALRTELAAADAEITFVRARLDDVQSASNITWNTVVSAGLPFGLRHAVGSRFSGSQGFPNIRRPTQFIAPGGPQPFIAPSGPSPLSPRVGFRGRTTHGRVFLNPGRQGRGSFAVGPSLLPFQSFTTFDPPYESNDLRYQRSSLVMRLDDLVSLRVGLLARWRELEEDARRAGAPPGWLRP